MYVSEQGELDTTVASEGVPVGTKVAVGVEDREGPKGGRRKEVGGKREGAEDCRGGEGSEGATRRRDAQRQVKNAFFVDG